MSRVFVLGLCVLFAGCGGSDRPEVAPVSGVVMLGSEPLQDATVSFHLEGKDMPQVGMGKTDSEGKFSITTYDTNDGAYLGKHIVTVSKIAAGSDTGGNMEMGGDDYGKAMTAAANNTAPPKQAIPVKFTKKEDSPLRVTVESGGKSDVKLVLE